MAFSHAHLLLSTPVLSLYSSLTILCPQRAVALPHTHPFAALCLFPLSVSLSLCSQAGSLVLLDDDFSSIVNAVALGRRIFANLRRAMQYIVAVHVPIALMSMLPPLIGWVEGEASVLYAAHIVLMELVIDPSCSVVFENEAADPGKLHPALFVSCVIVVCLFLLFFKEISHLCLGSTYRDELSLMMGIHTHTFAHTFTQHLFSLLLTDSSEKRTPDTSIDLVSSASLCRFRFLSSLPSPLIFSPIPCCL